MENVTKNANQSGDKSLFCFGHFLLGYFYFYELHWNLVSSLIRFHLGVTALEREQFQPVRLGS